MAGIGAALFLLAYDGGTYGLSNRGSLAVAAWWVILLAVGAGLWPLARLGRATLLAGCLLAAFAGWTLASTIWADSAENAFDEFNRVTLYVGIFFLAALAATRWSLARWSDGLALGIVATAGLSFFTRCFPDVFLTEKNLSFLPVGFTRLSYPLEYWNGLAIFVALGVPLLLRAALVSRQAVVRSLAVAPLPVLAAVVFFASSRGGAATAVVGVAALLLLVPSTRAFEATLAAAFGAAAGVASVARFDRLVNDPGVSAAGQGHRAFAYVLASCAATSVLYFLSLRYLGPRVERGAARVPTVWRRVALAACALLIVGGIVAAHPVRLFETFKAPPPYSLTRELPPNAKNPIQTHLLSGGSSGRWQQWETVLDEFRSAPVVGRGAGSYEAWWAQHGSLLGYVRDAHSLYLETLGELGIVGFLLIVAAFVTGLVAGVRRTLASAGGNRVTVAALTSSFVAYAFAAGIDWMWEMTVVSVVGIVLLGLVTSRAAGATDLARPMGFRLDLAGRLVLVVAALAVIAAQGVALVTDRELDASKSAAERGDLVAAAERADNARKVEPWAASPYIQLALVAEQASDYDAAAAWAHGATVRNSSDWRPWYLSARFELFRGHVRTATARLCHAVALNPRSDLFEDASCEAQRAASVRPRR